MVLTHEVADDDEHLLAWAATASKAALDQWSAITAISLMCNHGQYQPQRHVVGSRQLCVDCPCPKIFICVPVITDSVGFH